MNKVLELIDKYKTLNKTQIDFSLTKEYITITIKNKTRQFPMSTASKDPHFEKFLTGE